MELEGLFGRLGCVQTHTQSHIQPSGEKELSVGVQMAALTEVNTTRV